MRVARMMTSVRIGVTRTSTPVHAPLCSSLVEGFPRCPGTQQRNSSRRRTAVAVLSQLARQQLVQLSVEHAVCDKLQRKHTRWR